MLLAVLGSVRIAKNCDRGLENAARGCRLRAAFSREERCIKEQIYFELLYVSAFSSLVNVSKTVFPV